MLPESGSPSCNEFKDIQKCFKLAIELVVNAGGIAFTMNYMGSKTTSEVCEA